MFDWRWQISLIAWVIRYHSRFSCLPKPMINTFKPRGDRSIAVKIEKLILPRRDAVCRRSLNCRIDLCVKLLFGIAASPMFKYCFVPAAPGPLGAFCVPIVEASFDAGLIEARRIFIMYEISAVCSLGASIRPLHAQNINGKRKCKRWMIVDEGVDMLLVTLVIASKFGWFYRWMTRNNWALDRSAIDGLL